MPSLWSNECPNDTEEDCDHGPVASATTASTASKSMAALSEDEWLEEELAYGFRLWHVIFLSIAAVSTLIILLCCCVKFRIPRTKQEIEGDYIRRKILRKFRRRLKSIQNQELDDMDLKKGVMEKLNLGPDKLLQANPGLIYARLSGYGQTGPYHLKAGHDINYLAISGILSMLGRRNEKPTPPINLLADFGGGGLLCTLGIVMSLFERQTSKKGQVVDLSMVEGSAYLSSFVFKGRTLPIWGNPRGENMLDTGAPFYDTFKTKDGKYMAVGSLEPQFFEALKTGLGLDINQFDDFQTSKEQITARFESKTRDEWTQIFDKLDACVTPVLEMDEAIDDVHNRERKAFVKSVHSEHAEPEAAPKLSRTPGKADLQSPDLKSGEHTVEVLQEYGYSQVDIKRLMEDGAIESLQSKL